MIPPFEAEVLRNDPERRPVVLRLLAAALEAVEPEAAVRRALEGMPEELSSPPILISFGKAAPAMARSAARVLPSLRPGGLVVASHAAPVPPGVELVVASHPTPDARSVEGGRRALRLAEQAGPDDLVLCLISGGGSSLLEVPAGDLSLEDLVATTGRLLRSGADIVELNTVRKHLSAVKGGRLGAATAPARLLTLVLSDVVGNPFDAIASGPTVPDPTSFADALEVLERRNLLEAVPQPVLDHLRRGAAGELPDTPAEEGQIAPQTVLVVGDAATAAEGARRRAEEEGLPARVVTARLAGEARQEATRCVEEARRREGVLIWAGETTVTVRGEGRGGRNQEAALSAALALREEPRIIFAALGTDGIDGPTDAAGGVADAGTLARARRLGLSAEEHLARNDSYPFLRAVHDQLRTGPTGTNVGDVWLAWTARDLSG